MGTAQHQAGKGTHHREVVQRGAEPDGHGAEEQPEAHAHRGGDDPSARVEPSAAGQALPGPDDHAGDLRTVAIASVRLGRVLRPVGERQLARPIVQSAQRWYRAAGGGDAATLAEYLLAALHADDGAPQADQRLSAVIATARKAHDVEIEVLALDTLARIHAEQEGTVDAWTMLDTADRLMPRGPTPRHRQGADRPRPGAVSA